MIPSSITEDTFLKCPFCSKVSMAKHINQETAIFLGNGKPLFTGVHPIEKSGLDGYNFYHCPACSKKVIDNQFELIIASNDHAKYLLSETF